MKKFTCVRGCSKPGRALVLFLAVFSTFFVSWGSVFASALPGPMTAGVSKSTYASGENVIVNWTTSSNASKYGLTVWKPPYNADQYAVWDNYVYGNSQDVGTFPPGRYQVNMKPYNASGGGPISNIFFFTVTDPAAAASAPATAPTLPGPMTISASPTFTTDQDIIINWTTASGATKYGLTLWKPPYGSDQYAVWDNYVTGNSANIGKLPPNRYLVNMKPYNNVGGGADSNVIYVTVTAPATAPVPTQPSPHAAAPAPGAAQPSAQASSVSGKQKQDDWFRTAVGKPMNPDGQFGFQCVDVADDYSQTLFGDWRTDFGSQPTNQPTGYLFDAANATYFTHIRNDPNDQYQIPQHGDIIVWNGHIAVVDSATPKSLTVIQQNRMRNYGSGYVAPRGADQYAERYTQTWGQSYKYNGGPIGWLRPNLQMSK